MASVGITAKSGLVWHEVHCAVAAYGMWLAGLSWPLKNKVLEWHCEQSPLLGCWASEMAKVVAAPDLGRVWKPLYCVFDEPSTPGLIG